MKKKSVDNKDGYNQWSKFYDTYSNPTVAIDELTFPSFYSHLKKMKVLEIGCGTGRHTTKLLKQGNFVTGIDLSPGMLEKAREKIPANKVLFIEGDFMTFDTFKIDPFDAVISSLVVEHIRDLKKFFHRAAGLLKEGGEFILSEIHPIRAARGSLAHFKTEGEEEITLESSPHSEQEFLNAIAQANFTVLKNEDIKGVKELKAMKPAWKRYIGVPMIKVWALKK